MFCKKKINHTHFGWRDFLELSNILMLLCDLHVTFILSDQSVFFRFPMNFDIFWNILLWFRWCFCCFARVFFVVDAISRGFFSRYYSLSMLSHLLDFIDWNRSRFNHFTHTNTRSCSMCAWIDIWNRHRWIEAFRYLLWLLLLFFFSFHLFLIALCFSAAYFCHLNCYKCLYLVCRLNRICKFTICYVRNYVKYEFNDWTECVLLVFSFRFIQVLEQNDSIYTMSKFLLTVSSGNWLKVNSLCVFVTCSW